MNLLLDTHTLIWFLNGDNQLSNVARELIEKEINNKYVSVASLWEIAIKISLKKLNFDPDVAGLANLIFENGFEVLPITFEHILEVAKLDFIHRDPFDRILIAQGIKEHLLIVTKDENIKKYEVLTIW